MRRFLVPTLISLSILAAGNAVALAAEAGEVADAVASDGFFVEAGSGISRAEAGNLVGEMRNAGENFFLVVLSDEPPSGATVFADAVLFELGRGLVLVISPESLGLSGEGEFFNESEFNRALDRAIGTAGSDADLATAFVNDLLGVAGAVPTTAEPQATAAPSSGSGANGLLLLVVIAGAVGLLLWWLAKRAGKKRTVADTGRLDEARRAVQVQLNDIANDILEMEDEVRSADNDRVDRFYEQATQTYNEAPTALAAADSGESILALSNKLDVTIWQLDSAESILDDKPLPERPEPRRMPSQQQPERPPERATVPQGSSYDRRPTRRSSYSGGGLLDLLIMAGGAIASSRGRSGAGRGGLGGLGRLGRLGGLGGLLSRSRRSSTPPPRTPASRQRSNPVPGPGRPATPSQPRQPSAQQTRRRGTSGRIRSGRKRRRK